MSDYTQERWAYLKALAPRSGTVVAHKLSANRLARKAAGQSRRQWKRIGGVQRTQMIEYAQSAIARGSRHNIFGAIGA